MKAEIHPEYKRVPVRCTCGHEFEIGSSMKTSSLSLEVCNLCHPFYTGKQKIMDTAGRVDNFNRRFGGLSAVKNSDKKQS